MKRNERKNKRGRLQRLSPEFRRLLHRLQGQDREITCLHDAIAEQKSRDRVQVRIIEYQKKAIDLLIETRDEAYSTIGFLKDHIKEHEQRRT